MLRAIFQHDFSHARPLSQGETEEAQASFKKQRKSLVGRAPAVRVSFSLDMSNLSQNEFMAINNKAPAQTAALVDGVLRSWKNVYV
jgi:hypothetical protein